MTVLLGIVIGGVLKASFGIMHFDKVVSAGCFELIMPLRFGMPIFDLILIATVVLVMIESTGMLLALRDMTGRKVNQPMLLVDLPPAGLGAIISCLFNTFPYTSFLQNVWLVSVTGGIMLIISVWCPRWARWSRRCRLWCWAGPYL